MIKAFIRVDKLVDPGYKSWKDNAGDAKENDLEDCYFDLDHLDQLWLALV
jgi:hypothetical protein